ncbi:MAG: hypothetical protein DRZ90_13985 [Spirochaetes bacterium]|nr:MAG: hypothetical protein DRP60_04390 [Spirochaetota bacterium]RKX92326.1 MAG: hypothetical protein DRZ90_13985 [Spirochaetota bacterium]
MSRMGLWKPALLSIAPFGMDYNRDIEVESRTGGGRYTVNLYSYTCTCPDFTERRAMRPIGDLGRSCKHLRDAVLSLDTDAFGDELTRVIFKSPHGPYERIWFAPGPEGDVMALGMRSDKPWLSLFHRGGPGESYTRYGYHPEEKRWAYDSRPPEVEMILGLLKSVPDITLND